MMDPFRNEALRSSEAERRRQAEHGRVVRDHLVPRHGAARILAGALRAAADRLDRRPDPTAARPVERARAS